MGNSLHFSKAQGFVALPCALLDLDITPGAFRLLVELCRMANAEGQCWPSLGQLSARTGRSKASLSAYLTELRAQELVETQTQRMANGYNYRLRYTLPFWKSWRAGLGRSDGETSDQAVERSDQPAERRVNSKNQTHENHSRFVSKSSKPSQLARISRRWQDLCRGVSFPAFNQDVSQALVQQTREAISKTDLRSVSSGDMREKVIAIWSAQNLSVPGEDLNRMVTQLEEAKLNVDQLGALASEVQRTWKAHWRRPPSELQFAKLISDAKQSAPDAQYREVLQSYLRRWEFSRKQLQRVSPSQRLAA